MRRHCVLTAAILLTMASAAVGQQLTGPDLAAASNFGQGWLIDIFKASRGIPVMDFRDAVYWDRVEQADGSFRFDRPTTRYPGALAAAGARMSLTVNNGHPLYDDGNTPYSADAIRAFGHHAAVTVAAFPAIHSVEVGNEFNSANFVSGPVKAASLDARAAHYVDLLKSTYTQVKAQNPAIRILGGGVHSIPVGYLARVFALGGGDYMDALAIHPYTTPPEQLRRQIGVLRDLEGAADMPIEVTEFGDDNPGTAPGYLVRNYCQMALSGVTRAVWYPLNVRGDGLVPLYDKTGAITQTGQAFGFVQQELMGRPVRDVAPDPFTYACLFGGNRLVIWGEPRAVSFADPSILAFDAAGRPLDPSALRLSMDAPIVVLSEGALEVGRDVLLAPQRIVADSYHQFGYPQAGSAQSEGDGFARFARRAGKEVVLSTLPGQERASTFWTPYRGHPRDPSLRLTAEILLPGGTAENPVEIVHRFRADTDMTLEIDANWTPVSRSEDGVRVEVRLNDDILERTVATGLHSFVPKKLTLRSGDVLEFIVGPNGTARGDVTDYRITLRRTGL